MKEFVRLTTLSDISGRSDYIRNQDKQEAILTTSAPMDWAPYQAYEKNNQKTSTENNEGRELIIALPNSWAELPAAELASRVASLAFVSTGKPTDQEWAVHWNKKRTNLHVHVIFSERTVADVSHWDRDIYQTADGKVARRKADRATDAEGHVLPPIHKKGDIKGGFSTKNVQYSSPIWLSSTKEAIKQTFFEKWGEKIEENNPLHEYHEGKGKEAPIIRAKNEKIREFNHTLLRIAPGKERENTKKQMVAAIQHLDWDEAVQAIENIAKPAQEPAKRPVPAQEPAKRPVPAQEPAKRPVPAQEPAKPTKISIPLGTLEEASRLVAEILSEKLSLSDILAGKEWRIRSNGNE